MNEILDHGIFWELILDENITPTEEINKPMKGYIALIGINKDTGSEVISYVKYHKQYINDNGVSITRSIEDVQQKVIDLNRYKLKQRGS